MFKKTKGFSNGGLKGKKSKGYAKGGMKGMRKGGAAKSMTLAQIRSQAKKKGYKLVKA
tara:strand:+ start:466 stop:639 length:174 start_codon:yes stop_codon:yes gene_type:complete